jgi:hypothetical protein
LHYITYTHTLLLEDGSAEEILLLSIQKLFILL